jgi:hypothetical protein
MYDKLELGESILVARAFEPSKFAPQHAIWFQRKGNVQAYVSRVNNQYKIEIYKVLSDKSGKLLIEDYEETLPLARKAVFQYFDNHVAEANLKFIPEMEAAIMELPIFKFLESLGDFKVFAAPKPKYTILPLGDSLVFAASKAQKEAKRKEANKSQKENKEKKKEAAPKKEAPKDPNQEMVKNPNPEGRDKEVTKEAADKWNRENGKGGSDKPAAKPEEKPEPKKEEKPEDKHAEQIKESGEAAKNVLKDLGPKEDAPAPKNEFDDNLDFLKGPEEKKPEPEEDLSEDDKLADEQGVERPSYQEGKKFKRDERKEYEEAIKQYKLDHPEDKDEPKPDKKAKPEEPAKTEPPAKPEEPKPNEPKKPEEPKPTEPKKPEPEAKKPEPKPVAKPLTPEQRKKKVQDLVSSDAYEMLKDEDQEALDSFLKDPKLQEHPGAIEGIEKLLKKYTTNTKKKNDSNDYSIRDLTNVDEHESSWSLKDMLEEFKTGLGI